MAGDARRALIRLAYMSYLDGARPSTVRGWVNPVAPVVVQAATGAGHWSAGRRQRALAEWAGAAGFGLVAWGLGTEAPTPAEVQPYHQRLMRDVMRERGITAPAAARTETPAARRIERFFRWFGLVSPVAEVVLSVRGGCATRGG